MEVTDLRQSVGKGARLLKVLRQRRLNGGDLLVQLICRGSALNALAFGGQRAFGLRLCRSSTLTASSMPCSRLDASVTATCSFASRASSMSSPARSTCCRDLIALSSVSCAVARFAASRSPCVVSAAMAFSSCFMGLFGRGSSWSQSMQRDLRRLGAWSAPHSVQSLAVRSTFSGIFERVIVACTSRLRPAFR
jgi:hypothetical protein